MDYNEKIRPRYSGYQELHIHSTGSYRDAVNTVEEIFGAAERLGRKAVSITDHGNMVRIFDGLKERTKREKKALAEELRKLSVSEEEVKKILSVIGQFDSIRQPTEKMKPYIAKYEAAFVSAVERSIQFIPSIEGYFTDGDNERMHICLYAKDYIGLQAIFKMNNRSQLNKSKDMPQISFDILEDYVGEGKQGHGHVICTSACIAGHLSRILLKPQYIDNKIALLREKLSEWSVGREDSLSELENMLADYERQLAECRIERAEAKKSASRDFSGRISKLESRLQIIDSQTESGSQFKIKAASEERAKILVKIDELRQSEKENKLIAAALNEKEERYSLLSAAVKNTKEAIKAEKKTMEPYVKIRQQIAELENEKASLGDTYTEAKNVALRYDKLFGRGNYYIELQNHGIPEELIVIPLLKRLAAETGIPLTVSNDVHYASPADKRKRDIIAATRFNQPIKEISKKKGNDQLYFKSDEEMAALFSDVPEAIENTSRIAESCNVFYHKEMHLPTFDTKSDMTPIQYLESFARSNISKRYPNYNEQSLEWKTAFEERLNYELDVIEKMGYASYIAIVQDFIAYAKSIDGKEKVGPGRESAAGSLLCYLTEITDIDPLRYVLIFERFLNPDRVSMPDIDTDFAPSIRDKVIEYVDRTYEYKLPYDEKLKSTTCGIYTESILCGRSAVRAVARVTGIPSDISDRIAKMIPAVPNMTVSLALKENKDFKRLYDSDKIAQRLINDTLLIEGLPDHTGVHAAGIIISDVPISEYAPMFWNEKKGCWVVQCDMVACEKELGCLKMDFLGLKNLDIISTASKMAGGIDFDKVNAADDPSVISDIYAKGDTNGIFQFESGGMKQTLKSFRPVSIDDIILLNAAYRPGPQQYIPEITDIKFGKKQPAYLVPEMQEILEPTYSKPIYQEQIQQIFHKVAGFSLGEADIIRRAMAKKHLNELEAYKDKFFEGMKARGVADSEVEAFWNELLDFASYAFNKSHAAAYSILSYQTAYLKKHHTAAYMAALLCYTSLDKIPLYIKNAEDRGIKMLKPDINKSAMSFSFDENSIMFGLGNIKSVKNGSQAIIDERNAHGPFISFKDLICRACITGIRKSIIESLILSGAMDSICKNRKVYYEILDEYYESCRKALKKIQADSYGETYRLFTETWVSPVISDDSSFSKEEMLAFEKEYLGFYTSGHPLEDKVSILDANSDTKIADIDKDTKDVVICGQVKGIQVLRRKSDGKAMCKFSIEDLTGEVDCICITREYERYSSLISENALISIKGIAEVETDIDDDGEVTIHSLQVRVTYAKSAVVPDVVIINAGLDVYADIVYPKLKEFGSGSTQIMLFDRLCNEMRKTEFCINDAEELIKWLNENKIDFNK